LQIAKNSISRWGRGEVVPRLDVLMVIAKDFGVSLDYMVTEHK
jgi:transcriptional regulator with XRE-family HTH domain